jgi:diguanylate cyclase (GGDEF)-like protein
MSDRVVCPVCSGVGEVDPRDQALDLVLRDRFRPEGDRSQVASDQVQTPSDPHQRGHDHDRFGSDDDQHPSRDGAATLEDAEEVPPLEDETAWSTLEAAEGRDRAAELRDRGAEGRDLQARMREVLHDDPEGAENVLLRAGRDRARAADDRAKAAADRTSAAVEREQAAHDRAAALQAQAEARHDAQHNLMLVASDELTGALTRQFGLEGVSHEIDRAGRSGGRLVLAAIDVDRLVEVKHALGQAGADRLLRFVGDSLRANVRSYDLIVRYREDEFLCAMPNITRAAATKRLTTVAAVLTAADKQQAITFGVAEYDPRDELQDILFRAGEDLLASRSASGRE